MSEKHLEALRTVFAEVMEKVAFVFLEEDDDQFEMEAVVEGFLAEMEFSGMISGQVSVAMPSSHLCELAASVLGLEADDEAAVKAGEDSLKEILNMTCGQMLTTCEGSAPVFNLSIPDSRTLSADEWVAFSQMDGSTRYVSDEWPVVLRLVMS